MFIFGLQVSARVLTCFKKIIMTDFELSIKALVLIHKDLMLIEQGGKPLINIVDVNLRLADTIRDMKRQLPTGPTKRK